MAVMRQAIQQRRRHLRVPEHIAPLRERKIGRDDHARPLIDVNTARDFPKSAEVKFPTLDVGRLARQ